MDMEKNKIIQYVRKASLKSQKELADIINVAISTISRIESGTANVENTDRVCDILGIDFSRELFLINELDFYVIPENVLKTELDLTLPYFLIENYTCDIYVVESYTGLSQKLLRTFFGNCWLFLIIEIQGSFFIFHRSSPSAIIFPLNKLIRHVGINKQPGSKIHFVSLDNSKEIKSIFNHAITKNDLKNLMSGNIDVTVDVTVPAHKSK